MPNFDICYAIKIHRTKQTKGSDDDVFWNRHNGLDYGAAIRSSLNDYDSYFYGGSKYWIVRIFRIYLFDTDTK